MASPHEEMTLGVTPEQVEAVHRMYMRQLQRYEDDYHRTLEAEQAAMASTEATDSKEDTVVSPAEMGYASLPITSPGVGGSPDEPRPEPEPETSPTLIPGPKEPTSSEADSTFFGTAPASLPTEESLSADQAKQIQSVMQGLSLRRPEWANNIDEKRWMSELLTKIGTMQQHPMTHGEAVMGAAVAAAAAATDTPTSATNTKQKKKKKKRKRKRKKKAPASAAADGSGVGAGDAGETVSVTVLYFGAARHAASGAVKEIVKLPLRSCSLMNLRSRLENSHPGLAAVLKHNAVLCAVGDVQVSWSDAAETTLTDGVTVTLAPPSSGG